jgi:hypothetical protein
MKSRPLWPMVKCLRVLRSSTNVSYRRNGTEADRFDPGYGARGLAGVNRCGLGGVCLRKKSVFRPLLARRFHLLRKILAAGHSIGNHGHRHLNGWQTSPDRYMADVSEAAQVLHAECGFRSRLFRPPFGRLLWDVMLRLSRDDKIVMWDSLSMDYRPELHASK